MAIEPLPHVEATVFRVRPSKRHPGKEAVIVFALVGSAYKRFTFYADPGEYKASDTIEITLSDDQKSVAWPS